MGASTWFRGGLRAAVVVAVLALGACGTDPGDDSGDAVADSDAKTSQSTDAAGDSDGATPSCDEVWRVGEKLPRGYSGCVLDGDEIPPDVLECSSGQRLVRFDETYYAVRGGLIREAPDGFDADADYRAAVRSCRG